MNGTKLVSVASSNYPNALSTILSYSYKQSIEKNTTTLTFYLTLSNVNKNYSGTYGSDYSKFTLGDNTVKEGSYRYGYGDRELGSITVTVKHSSDGKFPGYTIAAQAYSYHFQNKPTLTGKLTSKDIPTIPRESKFTLSSDSVKVGEEVITVNITPASSSFRHNVKFYKDSANSYIKKNVEKTTSYTIPYSWFPDSSNGTIYCQVTTLSGTDGETIGNALQMSFNAVVSNEVMPNVGKISVSVDPINEHNVLVKGKNTFTISVSGSSAGDGSVVKSQTISGQGIREEDGKIETSDKLDDNPNLDFSVTGGPIDANFTGDSQEFKYTITTTDMRGRINSKETSIICYNYNAPYFASFHAYRANENGEADTNGTYLKCEHRTSYAPVNGTNAITIEYRVIDSVTPIDLDGRIKAQEYNDEQNAGWALIDLGDNNKTYQVYAIVTDLYGGNNNSATIPVFGQSRILNISKDGTGFAIGKMSEKPDDAKNGLFECKWDAKFYGTVEYEGTVDCAEVKINQESIFDLIYPVGSIYMSVNSADPSVVLFGGTWERIEDTFILAAGSTYKAGATGGSAEHVHATQDHKLTVKQIPAHSHTATVELKMASSNNTGSFSTQQLAVGKEPVSYTNDNPITISNGNTGGGEAHNHGNTLSASSLPPYLAVYVWKRIA